MIKIKPTRKMCFEIKLTTLYHELLLSLKCTAAHVTNN